MIFEMAKDDISSEIDTILAYAKTELVKLEARISAVASTVDSVASRVGIIALIGGAGFLVFEVIRKNL